MRLLFVKARLEWPRTYGHDVHCYEMMKALAGLGHEVALATDVEPAAAALQGLPLATRWLLGGASPVEPVAMSYLQERYRSYWGIGHERIASLRTITREWRPDSVVVVGLEILPYLAAPEGPTRVWYAADEWVWHYVSQLTSAPGEALQHLKQAAIKGVYERAFAPLMDRVWVVSPTERRAMRMVTGRRHIDIVPNGVDADTFTTHAAVPEPDSAVFWGRLGFGPNLQALRWFVERVWPLVRSRVPQASFTILGADPPAEVKAWHGRNGISVMPNLEDLRPEIARRAVVVLPFVSGGGIKNKFLEAAAMSRPIVATSRSTRGLRSQPPVVLADTPSDFAQAVVALWADQGRATALGAAARAWVLAHHTWRAAAEQAVQCLREDPGATRASPQG
jgi:glycosyltransferase involved in cell wall biosynthesis